MFAKYDFVGHDLAVAIFHDVLDYLYNGRYILKPESRHNNRKINAHHQYGGQYFDDILNNNQNDRINKVKGEYLEENQEIDIKVSFSEHVSVIDIILSHYSNEVVTVSVGIEEHKIGVWSRNYMSKDYFKNQKLVEIGIEGYDMDFMYTNLDDAFEYFIESIKSHNRMISDILKRHINDTE